MKGLTVIETIIVLALTSLLILGGASFMSDLLRDVRNTEDETYQQLEKDIAARYILRDIQKAQLSFNFILQTDDSGNAGFFDYVPSSLRKNNSDSTRTLTLSLNGPVQDFRFVIPSKENPIPYPYFPHKAYEMGPIPADYRLTASLTYKGVNQDNIVNSLNPGMWEENKWLLLTTPVWLYPTPTSLLPRRLQYLGWVRDGRLQQTPSALSIYRSDPQSPANLVTSPDSYFRRLPAIGGAAPVVLLREVQIVGYSVEPETVNGKTEMLLYRTLWTPSFQESEAERVLVARGLEKVIFHRPSISQKLIRTEFVAPK